MDSCDSRGTDVKRISKSIDWTEAVFGLAIKEIDANELGKALDPLEVLYAVRKTEAAEVVTTLFETGEPGISSHLLAEFPQILVLALSPRHDRATIYRQVLVREDLRGEADDDFLATIRRVAHQLEERR